MDTYFVSYKLTSNSSKNFIIFILTCPEASWRHAAPETGGQIQIFLDIGKLYPKETFCQVTYPLTPKTKPVYAKVSELPPPLI